MDKEKAVGVSILRGLNRIQFTQNQKDAGYVQKMLNAEYEVVGEKVDGLAKTRISAGTIVQRVDPKHPI